MAEQSSKVDLNTASREQLNGIPNIGDECADRIIDYRERKGGFRSIDELDQIPGVGQEAVRNLRQHATVQ